MFQAKPAQVVSRCHVGQRAHVCATLAALLLFTLAAGAQHVAELKPPPCRVIVLDDCDPEYKDKRTYADNVSFVDGLGRLRARISGLNVCEEIGSPHRLAVDADRQRVWLAETVGHRLLQYDISAKEIREVLAVPNVRAFGLAVEPASGNVWAVCSSGRLGTGWTDVYDPVGRKVATYDIRGYDIAFDRKSKTLWLAERQLLKVSRDGKVLLRQDVTDWCSVSVEVDPESGIVWVAARSLKGPNEVLSFDNSGKLRHRIPLAQDAPSRVSVDPSDGSIWVTIWRKSIRHYSVGGKLLAEHKIPALTAAVDPHTRNVWVATTDELLQVSPNGEIIRRTRHRKITSQAWIATF